MGSDAAQHSLCVFFKFFSICSVEATTIAPFDPFCSLILFTALFVVNLNALR